ncbi:MAG: U32 family peptidase [Clostridium sp.]|nr:U32 family peptidase [Clostridium sp.]
MAENRTLEILAPAGSVESMKAAVAAGADAVYMGGKKFGARAFADNPDDENLLRALDYMHIHGRKLYLTVNTLLREEELKELPEYLEPCCREGLDAVIVQDPGVLRVIRTCFPDLPIHASTQMTVTGPEFGKMLAREGVSRIVPARELSLAEVRSLHENTGLEIECFVHGALCFCYSGQCLFSSMIGGRSGNRGRCAQTCRLPFSVEGGRKTYPLSLRDLNTLDILPDILEAGVYSLKIEGRMKSPRYTAGCVSIYRKYADYWLEHGREGYHVDRSDHSRLLDLFDRGGQTEGYYRKHNGPEMIVFGDKPAFRKENTEYVRRLDEDYVNAKLQEPAAAHLTAVTGAPLSLEVHTDIRTREGGLRKTVSARAAGSSVAEAVNRPSDKDSLEKQIRKTGETPFYFDSVRTDCDGRGFVPVGALNSLRRNALEELENAVLGEWRRTVPARTMTWEPEVKNDYPGKDARVYRLSAATEDPAHLAVLLKKTGISRICPDSAHFPAKDWKKTVQDCHAAGKECFLRLPHIWRQEADAYFKKHEEDLVQAGFDGVILRAWEEIPVMLRMLPGTPLHMDFNMYAMNREAEAEIRSFCGETEVTFTFPAELNSREMEELSCRDRELVVYGAYPLMVTAQCFRKNSRGCDRKPGILSIADRSGRSFPVRNHCRFCYNTIYNAVPLSLLGEKERIDRLHPAWLGLVFTTESPGEVSSAADDFISVFLEGRERKPSGDFTKGHFRRGVD